MPRPFLSTIVQVSSLTRSNTTPTHPFSRLRFQTLSLSLSSLSAIRWIEFILAKKWDFFFHFAKSETRIVLSKKFRWRDEIGSKIRGREQEERGGEGEEGRWRARSFRLRIQFARYVSLYVELRVERDRTASYDTWNKVAPVKSRSWDVSFVLAPFAFDIRAVPLRPSCPTGPTGGLPIAFSLFRPLSCFQRLFRNGGRMARHRPVWKRTRFQSRKSFNKEPRHFHNYPLRSNSCVTRVSPTFPGPRRLWA